MEKEEWPQEARPAQTTGHSLLSDLCKLCWPSLARFRFTGLGETLAERRWLVLAAFPLLQPALLQS